MRRCGPGDYLIVGPTLRLLNAKTIPEFRRLFETILNLGTYIGNPKYIFEFSEEGAIRTFGAYDPLNPPRVVFCYAENPDSVESYTAKAVWMDEPGQVQFKVGTWQAIQRRLSLAAGFEDDEVEGADDEGPLLGEDGLPMGRALLTTTPYAFNWLKTDFYDRWLESELVETLDFTYRKRGKILHYRPERRAHPYYDVIRFESILNPRFSLTEYNRARRELPEWKFGLFYEARFTRPAGMIYDVWDEEGMTYDPKEVRIQDTWKQRFLGVDFGGVNTGAIFLAYNPDDERYYLYRTYKSGRITSREMVRLLLMGEPHKPLAYGGAGSEDNWRREWTAAGLPVLKPLITGQDSVEVGITKVYTFMKQDKLRVSKELTKLIDEVTSYSRELDDSNEPTEKIADKASYHLLDALRYIITYLSVAGAYSADIGVIDMEYANDQPRVDFHSDPYSPFSTDESDGWWGGDYGVAAA
jgi:hypothetical protein